MTVFTLMMGATGLTAVRVLASPDRDTGQLARVLIGGTIATVALATVEDVNPELARGFAALVFITAALTHGVALSSIALHASHVI